MNSRLCRASNRPALRDIPEGVKLENEILVAAIRAAAETVAVSILIAADGESWRVVGAEQTAQTIASGKFKAVEKMATEAAGG